jgi:hypothetical protein
MRLSSPMVRGLEYPEDCTDMLAVIKFPFRDPTKPDRTSPHQFKP